MIAHELAHIRNRDMLITTVAAAIGGAITWLGYMLLFMGGDDDSPLGLVGALAMVLLAPIAATIIQLAISRQREFSADATGARIAGSANALADALERLEAGAKAMPMQVNSGGRAAVHRQAVRRRRHEGALLDPPPDRGAGAPAARARHLDSKSSRSGLSRSFGNMKGAEAAAPKGAAALFSVAAGRCYIS